MTQIARIAVAAIFFWSHVSMAGWIIGNGGDGLRLQFRKAKEHAAHLTVRVSERALASVASAEVVAWIMEHQDALASDILASPHLWTEDEKPTCAWTTREANAVVEFSYPTCILNTEGFNEAGALLIHESVHHFGVESEEFADAVAIAIYEAYKSGQIDWLATSGTGSPAARSGHSLVWMGEKAIVFGGLLDPSSATTTNSTAAYDPATNSWQTLASTGAPSRYKHVALAYKDKMIVWGGLTATSSDNVVETWHNDGAIYDMATDTWQSIDNPHGPNTMSIRINGRAQTAVVVGDELIVWGGAERSGSRYVAVPGAAYNLVTKRWRQIADGGPARRQDHVAVATDGKMIVWGGIDVNNRASDAGAIYDPTTNSWQNMATSGAPEGLDAPVAVWTGRRFIVFGGYYSSREIKGIGGQYDPATNTWSSFVTEIAFGRTGHSAVWTGQEMVVFGGWNSRLRTEFSTPIAYDPELGTWRALSSANAPRARFDHAATWTGNKMLIWGGFGSGRLPLASGGLFYP